jgi:probable HAF family extracellular repeat protein
MLLAGFVTEARAQQYTFTTIDFPGAARTGVCEAPNGPPGSFCPIFLNNKGDIVGNYQDQSGIIHGFLFSGGAFTTLPNDPDNPYPPNEGCATCYLGINANGDMVGYYPGDLGFLYSAGNFTTIGSLQSIAYSINDAGFIVGYPGWVYKNGVFSNLPGIGRGINNVGQIAGCAGPHGFISDYNGANVTYIDDPAAGPSGTCPRYINDLGQIVGYYVDNNNAYRPFLYSNGAWTTFNHPLGANGTWLGSINNAGQISGTYYDTNGISHGFVASPSAPPPALQVSPSTSIASSGTQGEGFSPTSFSYQISSTNGSVAYSISSIPAWLSASFTSGTASSTPVTVTFTLVLNGVTPGTYSTNITFINTTNGRGNINIPATLTVNAGTKDGCKDGGWQNYVSYPGPFKNQGQCVSYFAKQ